MIAALGDDESDRVVAATALQAVRPWPQQALHFVHVLDVPAAQAGGDGFSEGAPPGVEELCRWGHAYLEGFTHRCGEALGRPVRGHLLFGGPAAEIMKLAKRLRASLLVLGTREVGPATRWSIGSTAHTLLHRAPCSVLLARPPAYEAEEGDEISACPDCLWAEASSCGVTPRCWRHARDESNLCL
ncbi:MAG TPA: universal stress protein [Polyangiaceae bacterium]|nr:universal stress protein [Polyangiaceae bacterium]